NKLVLAAERLCSSSDRTNRFGIDLVQQRDDFDPDHVSGVVEALIAAVGPKLELSLSAIAFDLSTLETQQRPDKAELTSRKTGKRRDRTHPRETARAGASNQPQQNSLGLIVHGVTGNHDSKLLLPCDASEKLVANSPGGFLDAPMRATR